MAEHLQEISVGRLRVRDSIPAPEGADECEVDGGKEQSRSRLWCSSTKSTGALAKRSIHSSIIDEIKGTHRGMMIAIPPEEWRVFHNMTFTDLSQILKHLAGLTKLRAFRRHPRGPKIAQPKRTYLKNKPHVSTAKILAQKAQNINTP